MASERTDELYKVLLDRGYPKEEVYFITYEGENGRLRAAIEDTGYQVTAIKSEPYEKKGFSFFRK